jgi:hypothetical protein
MMELILRERMSERQAAAYAHSAEEGSVPFLLLLRRC